MYCKDEVIFGERLIENEKNVSFQTDIGYTYICAQAFIEITNPTENKEINHLCYIWLSVCIAIALILHLELVDEMPSICARLKN